VCYFKQGHDDGCQLYTSERMVLEQGNVFDVCMKFFCARLGC